MDEQHEYVETEDQHEHAESMSPESMDSTLGATAGRQLPPSDSGENSHRVVYLSDECISRICSDTLKDAYDKATVSVREDRSLGLFGDVTPSPPSLSPQASLTAGEETSGRPLSGRSASPCRRPLSGRGKRSSCSHSSHTSMGSRASSGRRSRGELLSPDAKESMIQEIITVGSDRTPGSIDLGEASSSSSSSSSSLRSTPTTNMVASKSVTFLLDGIKSVEDVIQYNMLSPEVEKEVGQSLVNSMEANLKRLRILDAQVPVVIDERDNNPTSHTDLIPDVKTGCSSDSSDEVTNELAIKANDLEDNSFMEEKNWVVSPNSSCDSDSKYTMLEESEISSEEGKQEFCLEEFISVDMPPLHADDTVPQTGGQGDSRAETSRTVLEASAVPEHSHYASMEFIPIVASMSDVSSYVTITTFSSISSSTSSTTTNSSVTTPETQTRAESMEAGCCHIFCPCLRQKKAVGPAVKELKIPRKSKGQSCKGKSSKNSMAPVPADAPAAQTSKKPGFARRFAAAALQAFCFGCCAKKIKH